MEYLGLELWHDDTTPCLDPDSTLPIHQGNLSIGRFQTHSRFFYAPVQETCCGREFVKLLYQQFHPLPHCPDCARLTLYLASYICWQCRTYFRRYGTGMMKQLVGSTPQRHNIQDITMPERGLDQFRLPEEERAQERRDSDREKLNLPIMQQLLPTPTECTFWNEILPYFELFGNSNLVVAHPPTIAMPFYSNEALYPLPPNPNEHISTYQSTADVLTYVPNQEVDNPPPL